MEGPEIYVKRLFQLKKGRPFWDADPQDEPPVEIGDVGYIENGAWVRLFNASRPVEDDYNKLGVPAGHYPLHIGTVQKRSLSASLPIMSEGVSRIGTEVGVAVGALGSAELNFTCSKEQGAVLLLGDDADRRDTLHKSAFVKYILDNHSAWLDFANQRHERSITLNDLTLVTGCDKTSAWACAAFSGKSQTIGFTFGTGGASLVRGGVWASREQSRSVEANSGPRKYLERNPSLHPTLDQCVFMRGYKVCNRKTWLALRPLRKNYGGLQYFNTKGKKETTPLDILLDYIIENSKVELALVHDVDLITLLNEKAVGFVDDLMSWIRKVSPRIFVENQVGMLETTYRTSLSKASSQDWTNNLTIEQSQSQMYLDTLHMLESPSNPSDVPFNKNGGAHRASLGEFRTAKRSPTARSLLSSFTKVAQGTSREGTEQSDPNAQLYPSNSQQLEALSLDVSDSPSGSLNTPSPKPDADVIVDLPGQVVQFTSVTIETPLSVTTSRRRYTFDFDKVPNLSGHIKIQQGPLCGGAFAEIYLGDLQSEHGTEPVAMKMLRIFTREAHILKIKKKFRREVRLWCFLRHPYVLPFYGVCDFDEFRLFMVSPWAAEGTSLEYLRKNPSADRNQLLWQTASALEYLHSGQDAPQIVHGDLKADNVLISSVGKVLLCDFGLSMFVEDLFSKSGSSSGGPVGGHPRFMAPELLFTKDAQRTSRPTPESDVFAFGSLMLQIYTEQPPFGNLMEAQAILKIVNGEQPPRPTERAVLQRGCDDRVWDLMQDCWKYESCARPKMEEVSRRMSGPKPTGKDRMLRRSRATISQRVLTP